MMKLTNITILSVLFLCFSNSATALDITVTQKSDEDKQILTVSGELRFPQDGVFPGINELVLNKDIDLFLNSSGGEVLVAIRLNEQLNSICSKEDGCTITAIVKDGEECFSSCTLLFFNAHLWGLNNKAKMGVHGISTVYRNRFTGEVVDIRQWSSLQSFALLHQWGFPIELLHIAGIEAFRSRATTMITLDMLKDFKERTHIDR